MNIAYVNGEFIEHKDAKISIFDRGLLFGDGIYEVLPVYQSKPFFLDRHLDRLHSSLAASKISTPNINWKTLCEELIALNKGQDHQIYIQITRGNQGFRHHDIPPELNPTVIAYTLHVPFPKLKDKEKGLKACIVEDYRWQHCQIKSTSLLANILLNDEAVSKKANTALLFRDGYLTEGSTSNVFIVDNANEVRTPPLTNLCLPGVTRQITLELLEQLKIKVTFDPALSKADLLNAKEVWITSTTKEIYPVSAIDEHPIQQESSSPIWKQVDTLYQQLVTNHHD